MPLDYDDDDDDNDDNDDDNNDDFDTGLLTYMGVMVRPGRLYQHLRNHW